MIETVTQNYETSCSLWKQLINQANHETVLLFRWQHQLLLKFDWEVCCWTAWPKGCCCCCNCITWRSISRTCFFSFRCSSLTAWCTSNCSSTVVYVWNFLIAKFCTLQLKVFPSCSIVYWRVSSAISFSPRFNSFSQHNSFFSRKLSHYLTFPRWFYLIHDLWSHPPNIFSLVESAFRIPFCTQCRGTMSSFHSSIHSNVL